MMKQANRPVVLAAAAHPDDIEFMMAGTLLLLGDAGAELHLWNLANGSCGSMHHDPRSTAEIRTREARRSARQAGAAHHPPLVDDLFVYYEPSLLSRVAAVVRRIKPTIILAPSPQDYMEDHQNTSRLLVTAAFVRGVPNFETRPAVAPWEGDTVVYHAQPHGLRDSLRGLVLPEHFVNVSSVLERKKKMLSCHESQREWLDRTQGMGSYVAQMVEMCGEVGRLSGGRFEFAEGWRRHRHLGLSRQEIDPLPALLGESCWVDPAYVSRLG